MYNTPVQLRDNNGAQVCCALLRDVPAGQASIVIIGTSLLTSFSLLSSSNNIEMSIFIRKKCRKKKIINTTRGIFNNK